MLDNLLMISNLAIQFIYYDQLEIEG